MVRYVTKSAQEFYMKKVTFSGKRVWRTPARLISDLHLPGRVTDGSRHFKKKGGGGACYCKLFPATSIRSIVVIWVQMFQTELMVEV